MTTEADSIAALAIQGSVPHIITGEDGRQWTIVRGPGGDTLTPIPSSLPSMARPERIAAGVVIETAESLISYAKTYALPSAMLFANIERDTIVAALDYHSAASPEFVGHTATLKLQRSLEWQAWASKDGQMMPQMDFVNFLEESREDIVSPDAASLLEVCRDLQALRKVDFRSVVREGSENYAVEYANDTSASARKDRVLLPTSFLLSLPVYFDGERVSLSALLRWKLSDDNKLTLGFRLQRAERVRQAVFKGVVAQIADASGLAAVYAACADVNKTEDRVIDLVDIALEPGRRAKRMALRGPAVATKSPSPRAVKRLEQARVRYEVATIRAAKAKRGTIVERRIRKADAMTALLKAEKAAGVFA